MMPPAPTRHDSSGSPVSPRSAVPDVAVFSAKAYDRQFLDAANGDGICRLHYFEAALDADTVGLAAGHAVVCVFVNDVADAGVLTTLAQGGTRLLALVRRIPRAWYRTRDGNFTLDGLLGFDLHGRTVAVVGTGRIGLAFARIMHGFGCTVLGHDSYEIPEFTALGGRYVDLDEALAQADVVSLHCPLTPQTHHLVDARRLAACKPGLILVNSSRGGLVDTAAVIAALKSGQLGGVAIDVYEQEADVFYRDWSTDIMTDDLLERLLSFHNVIVTGHQAFFTHEAMTTISRTTIDSIGQFARGEPLHEELAVD